MMKELRFHNQYPKRREKLESASAPEARGPEDKNFSEQWKHPKPLLVGDIDVETLYDVRPLHEKDPAPIHMVPGIVGRARSFKTITREVTVRGWRTLLVDVSHGTKPPDNLRLHERASSVLYGNIIKRRVAAQIAAIEYAKKQGIRHGHAIGHSLGCLDVIFAALHDPEYFRGHELILVNPPGMIGRDSLYDLAIRNLYEEVPSMNRERAKPEYEEPIHPDDERYPNTDSEAYKTPRHAMHYMKELLAMSSIRIDDLLPIVRKLGIHISILVSDKDRNFPTEELVGKPLSHVEDLWWHVKQTGEIPPNAEEIIAAAEEHNDPFVRDKQGRVVMDKVGTLENWKRSIDRLLVMEGPHTAFIDHPAEAAQLIDRILTAPAKKREIS